MQKTRLGITVGMLAATIYFSGLFSGYLLAVILAGYVLLFEGDQWLRHNAIKAVAVMLSFSLLSAFVDFVPEGLSLLNRICNLLNDSFDYSKVNQYIYLINAIIALIEKILFIILGIKAMGGRSVNVPFVDDLLKKYMA